MVTSGYDWLWVSNGWLLVIVGGFGVVKGGYRWLRIVTGGFRWLRALTSGYWWLWVVMTTSDELLRSKKGEEAVSSRSLGLLNSLIHCSR